MGGNLISSDESVKQELGDVFITEDRIVKRKSFLGTTKYKDIQLDKIESIEHSEDLKLLTLLTGILLPPISFAFSEIVNAAELFLVSSPIAILLVGYALFTWDRDYKVSSASQSIKIPNKLSTENFLSELNSEINK